MLERVTQLFRYLIGLFFLYVIGNMFIDQYKTIQLAESLRQRAHPGVQSLDWTIFVFGYGWQLKFSIIILMLILALFLIPPTNKFIKRKTGIDINGWNLFALVVGLLLLMLALAAVFTTGSLPS